MCALQCSQEVQGILLRCRRALAEVMGFPRKEVRIARIRALLLFQLRFRSCHLTVSARKSPGLGDKRGPAARTPGPPPVPGLLSDLQQVASQFLYPFCGGKCSVPTRLLQLLLFFGMGLGGQINHGTSFPAGTQSQAGQEHLPRGFHSLVGAPLRSFCCPRALAASAPLCFSPSPGISRDLTQSLLSFFCSCRKELPAMLGTRPSPLTRMLF